MSYGEGGISDGMPTSLVKRLERYRNSRRTTAFAHTRTFNWAARSLKSGHSFITMMPTQLYLDAKLKKLCFIRDVVHVSSGISWLLTLISNMAKCRSSRSTWPL